MSDRLPIDAGDAILDGCLTGATRPIFRLLLYLSSLLLGGSLAGLAAGIVEFAADPSLANLSEPAEGLLAGFPWILCGFLTPAFPLVVIGLAFFLHTERPLAWWWMVSVVLQGTMWLAAGYRAPSPFAWIPWLMLCGMLGTTVWFFRAWQRSRWAREIAVLEAENAVRIAECEQARGDDHPTPPSAS